MKTILWFVFVFVVSERLVEALPTTEHGSKNLLSTTDLRIQKRSPRAISFYHGAVQRKIPFELDSSFSDKERCLVESVMYNLMSISCIRFCPKIPTDTTKFMSIAKFNQSTNSRRKHRENFVFLKSNDSYNTIMQKVLKFLILRPNLKAINLSFRCLSPLKLSMEFVRQFVRNYRDCKSYLNISTDSRSSQMVEADLVRKTRSTTDYTKSTKRLIHGDIMVRSKSSNRRLQDSAVDTITRLWPESGEIPYDLSSQSLEPHKCLLKSAMLQIMLNTCIRFRTRNSNDQYYLNVTDDSAANPGCWGSIGFDDRYSDASVVSLPSTCMNIGTVVHELIHAIGFYHHQSRPDRDEYLHILWDNIDESNLENFKTFGKSITRWDYNSVMLYGETAFGVNNKVTMKPKRAGVVLKEVIHKPGLTALDAAAINRLYKCKSSASTRLENNLYENGYFMKLFSELVDDDCHGQIGSDQSHLYMFVD